MTIVVPFAAVAGVVAGFLKCPGKRGEIRINRAAGILWQRLERMRARQHLRPAHMADRIARIRPSKGGAARDEAVKIRRLNHRIAQSMNRVRPLVIGDDEQDVRRGVKAGAEGKNEELRAHVVVTTRTVPPIISPRHFSADCRRAACAAAMAADAA